MTQENKTIDILEMNVEDTELIVRAWRALQDMQIFKVKDLVALKREEITAKWTMGKRTLDHVIDFMIDNKLLFAGEVETDQLPLQLAMNKLLRTPLQDCNFPVRMKEILHVNGARDIRHLLTLPRLHVLAWLGRKYFQELTDFLKEKGLKFDSVADKEHEELMKNNHVVYLMIEECGFTIRTNNELKACKIVSVAQLLVMTEKEFLSFSGVHRKTLAEVKEFLQKKGLKFVDSPATAVLEMEIKDCGLSDRSVWCLKSESIQYVKQLITFSETQLLSIPNFGRKSLSEVKEFLAGVELSLVSNEIDNLRRETKQGIQLFLSVSDDSSKEVIELWIKLNEPLLGSEDIFVMKAKCFLENINLRQIK